MLVHSDTKRFTLPAEAVRQYKIPGGRSLRCLPLTSCRPGSGPLQMCCQSDIHHWALHSSLVSRPPASFACLSLEEADTPGTGLVQLLQCPFYRSEIEVIAAMGPDVCHSISHFAPDTLPRQREDALHRQTLLPAPPAPVYPSSEAGGPPYPWYPPRNATTSLRRSLHSASEATVGGA